MNAAWLLYGLRRKQGLGERKTDGGKK